MNEDILFCDTVLTQLHNFQSETFLHQSKLFVLTEKHWLTVFQVDSILGTSVFVVYRVVGSVIEYNAVLQNLTHSGSFMVSSSLQNFSCAGTICGYTACKETSTGTEAEFSRVERIFYRTIRRGFADEATGRRRGILSFCQTVDAVVQQQNVDIYITTDSMDKVVTTDSQTVTIT